MTEATKTFNATIESVLGASPVFSAMDPSEIRYFANITKRVDIARGGRVFQEGSLCENFYILEKGRVKLYRTTPDGRPHIIHHVLPGQSFAEAVVFGSGRYPATAEALSDSTLIAVPAAQFLKRLRERTELYERVIVSLAMWLHKLVDRVNELTAGGAASRLAHYLVRQPASSVSGAIVIQLRIPKRDIAAQLSIAPETLSRILHDWEAGGIIYSRGRGIEVRDLSRLEKIADNC